MTKRQLVDIIKRILNTESDMNFLLKLDATELETLVAVIRDRIGVEGPKKA